MSESAICQAVIEQIKTVLPLPDSRCIDIRPDGKPTSAVVNDMFVAVHSEGQRFGGLGKGIGYGLNNGIDEFQLVGVTISLKTSRSHIDYWGLKLNQSWDRSMIYAVRKIVGVIHLRPEILQIANGFLETGISSTFIEMLEVSAIDPNTEQTSKWWGSETTAKGAVNPVVGYSRTLHFHGARRIQSMDYFS